MRKLLLSILLLLIFCAHAGAAVTFGQAAEKQISTLSTTFTIDVTVASGTTDPVMFIGFCTANGVAPEVSSIGFTGGQTPTLVTQFGQTGVGIHVYLYRLTNPTVGPGTVTVTLSTGRRTAGGVIILHGVDQTTPTDGQVSNNIVATSITINVSTAVGEVVTDVGCKRSDSTQIAMTSVGDRTERYHINTTDAALTNNVITAGSTRTSTGGGSNMAWSNAAGTTTYDYGAAGVSVNPAPVVAPTGGLSLGFKLLR